MNDEVCSICLGEPKKLEVASTCGHTYCAECILSLYQHEHMKIKCPLCRQEMNVLFKLFKLHEYNDESV
jgi:Zn finger protein HypA/HybF involved in hydrogenase expression